MNELVTNGAINCILAYNIFTNTLCTDDRGVADCKRGTDYSMVADRGLHQVVPGQPGSTGKSPLAPDFILIVSIV